MGDLLLASLTSAAAPGAGAVGAGGVGAGAGTPRSASWNISGRRRGEDKRAEGMMDWLAGLVRGMTATRLDCMDRAERQALMAETAELVVQMLDKRAAEDGFAHRSEVSALRRLQREAFQDLLRVKDRLHKLEYYTGIRRLQPFGAATAFPASPPSASAACSAGFGGSAGGAGMDLGGGFGFGLLGGSRTRMYGEVAAGSAFVPAEGERSHSARAGLEQAGMRSGLTVKLRLDTLCRRWGSGGNSSNTGNSGNSGNSGGSGTLSGSSSSSSSSSSGGGGSGSGKSGGAGSSGGSAQGKRREPEDLLVTELTSGLGEESSSFMLGGPVNLHKVLYCAALWDGVRLAVAPLGAVGSDVAEPINPLKPQENVVLAFSALNRVWPAPPLLASNGLHWSEMGPLVLPRVNPFGWGREGSAVGDGSSEASYGSGVGGLGGRGRGRGGDEGEEGEGGGGAGQELWLPPQDEPGTAVQSVAVAGAIQIGGMEKEDGAGALGLVQGEVYVRVPCARGVVLQPGVVVAHGPESGLHTAYMLRTCWEL
ncbi:unnamed protein product [Closterium sp. Naga37s-1]|nr:unnamed protein product [Closterium sp. Naga37s-1]